MLREIFHYLTLSIKTKRKLRKCFNLLNKASGEEKAEFEKHIKYGETFETIRFLKKMADKDILTLKEQKIFWSNLRIVAVWFKMRDEIIFIERKENEINIKS